MNRLFEIIYVLLNKKSITAKELAERFEVSPRTIYRYVDTLSLAGIPIYTEKGRGGGISLLPDFVLNKSILSEGEQEEILSALQSISKVHSAETGQVLHKLSTVFNKTVTNWLEVDFTEWGQKNSHIFNGFKSAILERRIAEFDYYGANETKTHRCIEAHQLWFKAKSWYVKGFCLTRQDLRLFKLSRVRNLTLGPEGFIDRDLPAHLQKPIPSSPPKPLITLKFRIDQSMTFRVLDEFDEDEFEKQPDGSFIVVVTWPEDNWVHGFLLSFGEHIEVLEPEHIRELMKEQAKKMLERHL